jgi:prepilin-type N-terminal cleavage/methylation domain-containing protein
MSLQSSPFTRPSRRGGRSISRSNSRSAFSLIELVIVVVIIGIIAAIAIPRMSRGSAGAADAAVQQNLSLLRNAIDMYQQEHNGDLPGKNGPAEFVNQMTGYSNLKGETGAKGTTYYLGPYLRSIPPITVGDNKGKNGVTVEPTAPGADTAWIYDATTGNIKPHTPGQTTDASGREYASY